VILSQKADLTETEQQELAELKAKSAEIKTALGIPTKAEPPMVAAEPCPQNGDKPVCNKDGSCPSKKFRRHHGKHGKYQRRDGCKCSCQKMDCGKTCSTDNCPCGCKGDPAKCVCKEKKSCKGKCPAMKGCEGRKDYHRYKKGCCKKGMCDKAKACASKCPAMKAKCGDQKMVCKPCGKVDCACGCKGDATKCVCKEKKTCKGKCPAMKGCEGRKDYHRYKKGCCKKGMCDKAKACASKCPAMKAKCGDKKMVCEPCGK